MGALEDDIDYGLKLLRAEQYKSHKIVDDTALWDELTCSECKLKGGLALYFNQCKFRYIYTGPGGIDPQKG